MANRIKGITVEIGGDTTGLDKALKSVNSSITKTQSALNDVNRLLKLDPSNTVLVAQKQELLAQAVSQTEEKLSALEAAQEQVAAAFARGHIGADKYQAFQREIEETRGKLNKYKADLSNLQTEQDALSQNTARLEKLFAATGTEVDDYADVLGTRLTSAIKNGTANSDQLRTALEKIGKSATGGKADIRQLTDALDTVDDGQAIQNLIQQLNEAGDAAENTADDVGQIAENTKGTALMQAADQLSAVGDKIQEIGDKALDAYTDTENAVTKVNAYFGETGQAAEQSANVIKNVYSSGVGESMDSVANAVLMVKKNLGDLSETDLTNLTQQAITLEELYGIDMNETLRGVNSLMQQYRKRGERMKRITKIEENMLLEKRKLRVAAYCRVSTARDEQLVSLAAQKAHYESYIKSNDEWEFAGLYYDEGISGTKKEKRDGLLAMVAACERGTIDFVITKSISRFARNTTDCLELVRKLLDLNIYIYFEKENINTGSMESELMLSILSGLAESESVSISENEKWGIKRRFQNGTFIISYPPYGYANVDGEMVIVPEQAEIVKQIFTDTLAGKSTHEIAKGLNERCVATKKGGRWTPSTINGIIGNEKYTGDVLFQKTYTDSSFNRHQNRGEVDQYLMQDHHEAIISKEEFELANAVLKQRGREKGNCHDTGKYQNRYGFSGRICCGECGGKYKRRMHYKPSGQYVAWTCANHLTDKNSCSQKYITDDALKLAFVTMMNKLVFGHQMVLRPLLQSLRGLNEQSRLLKIGKLEMAIEENREKKQVLTNLMASGYLEPALFSKENNELAAEAEALRQEKDRLMHSANGDTAKIEELQRLFRFVSKGTMMMAFDDEIFLSFVEQLTVLSRKEVVFDLKCGLSLRERLVEL